MKNEEFEALCYFNTLKDRALLEIIKEGKTTVDVGRWLHAVKASKLVAEDVLQSLTANKTELSCAVENPASEEREGYSYLPKPKLDKYYKFVCNSCAGCIHFIEEQYPKKLRKKKPVDPDKVVKNLKFLAKDESLNLQSVSPKDILEATMFLVYNTKNRTLILYHSKDEGLSVKGSTIMNWDEDKSQAKKLRKPQETLPLFVSVGYNLVQPRFVAIKTKHSKPNGRINGNMVLLWAKKK